jgi:peptidoglycan/LPS O-acetylase OafA/YrhL
MDWLGVGYLTFLGLAIFGSTLAFRRARARDNKRSREQWRLILAAVGMFGVDAVIVLLIPGPPSDTQYLMMLCVSLIVGLVTRHYRQRCHENEEA